MKRIGQPISPNVMVDWDHLEEHGSYRIFCEARPAGDFVLRCVVWRDTRTLEIIGHNFDYTRAGCAAWWTICEALTPEGCVVAVHPASRRQAREAIVAFRRDIYRPLMREELALGTSAGTSSSSTDSDVFMSVIGPLAPAVAAYH